MLLLLEVQHGLRSRRAEQALLEVGVARFYLVLSEHECLLAEGSWFILWRQVAEVDHRVVPALLFDIIA